MKCAHVVTAILLCSIRLFLGETQAAPIIQTFDYAAVMRRGPVSVITGSFRITYLSKTESVISAFSSSLPSDYQPYSYTSNGNKQIVSTNSIDPDNPCLFGAPDSKFCFRLDAPFDALPNNAVFYYVTSGSFRSFSSLYVVFAPSAVPLPASAPMFGAALLGLGGLGYVAKQKAKTAA